MTWGQLDGDISERILESIVITDSRLEVWDRAQINRSCLKISVGAGAQPDAGVRRVPPADQSTQQHHQSLGHRKVHSH